MARLADDPSPPPLSTTAATLLKLFDQFSGRYPCPSSWCGISADATRCVMKCHRVLRSICDTLIPGAIAAELEEVLASGASHPQKTLAIRLLLQRGGHVQTPLLRPAPHGHVLHALSGHPTIHIIHDAVARHSAQHHDGGWALAFHIAATAQRFLWLVHREPGWSARDACFVFEWVRVVGLGPLLASSTASEDTSRLWQHCGLAAPLKAGPDISLRSRLASFVCARLRLEEVVSSAAAAQWASDIVDALPFCAVGSGPSGSQLAPQRVQIRCVTSADSATPCEAAARSRLGIFLDRQLPTEVHVSPGCGAHGISSGQAAYRCLVFTEAMEVDDAAQLIAWLRTAGTERSVRLVACQRTVSAAARGKLYRYGRIVTLERLGITLLAPFCRVTGCEPLTTVHQLWAQSPPSSCSVQQPVAAMGHFRSLTSTTEEGRYLCFLEGVEDVCQVRTVCLAVPAGIMLPIGYRNLIESQSQDALGALCRLFSVGAVVCGGAGTFERTVSAFLRCHLVFPSSLRSVDGSELQLGEKARLIYGVQCVCDALDAYGGTFCGTERGEVRPSLAAPWSALLQAHAQLTKRPVYGPVEDGAATLSLPATDPWFPSGTGVPLDGPLDSFWAKSDAITAALETLELLFRVEVLDAVLHPRMAAGDAA